MIDRKVCFWDLETSFIEVTKRTFSLYDDSPFKHTEIVQDWHIICGCWKILGEKKIYSSSVTDFGRFKKDVHDDFFVVKEMRKAFEDVDILVAHNGNKFDLKKFKARLIYHDLPPLPNIVFVDTLLMSRENGFTSNRLDHLGRHLGYGGKMDNPPNLWHDAFDGKGKAIDHMVKYCKQDIRVLEYVYLKLRPHSKKAPNIASPDSSDCPRCASSKTIKSKSRRTAQGVLKQQYHCKDCGGYFTLRASDKSKSLSKL